MEVFVYRDNIIRIINQLNFRTLVYVILFFKEAKKIHQTKLIFTKLKNNTLAFDIQCKMYVQ